MFTHAKYQHLSAISLSNIIYNSFITTHFQHMIQSPQRKRMFPSSQQIQPIELIVKFQNQGQLPVSILPTDYLITLKQKIIGESGLNPNDLLLTFGRKNLLDETKKLHEYGIVKNETINAQFISSKSGVQFTFNNLRKKVSFQFSKNVPEHRLVDKGLNLEAVCKNPKCRAYRKSTFINKGYGQFNIGRVVDECTCPVCKQETDTAHNLGYYKTRIKIVGKKKGEKKGEKNFQFQDEVRDEKYYSFLHNNENIQQWGYIQVKTTELK